MLNRLLIDGRRRLAAIVAGTLVTLGASVAVSAPAEAAPPHGCRTYYGLSTQAGSYITVRGNIVCADPGYDEALPVAISRYASGVWQMLASGTGTVTYYCTGSAPNRYRVTAFPDFDLLCG